MIPNGSAYDNYPSFANNGTKTPPGGSTESAKYSLGMLPADTFPAEWANWLFHGATAGLTRLNSDTGSIKKEINNVLSNYNITPDASDNTQLMAAVRKIIAEAALAAHPVGSIYQNYTDSRNPATIFGGGTWAQITDKFLAAKGNVLKNEAGGIIGNFSYKLTESNIPAHTHGMGGTNMDMTSGELANIVSTSFDHYHSINATHDHEVNDPGHYHYIGNSPEIAGSSQLNMPVGTGGNNGVNILWGQNGYNPIYGQRENTGLTVKSKTLIFNSGYQNSDSQIVINQGNHAHYLATFGYADTNRVAVNTTPPYLAVYTWYRTA